MNPTSVDLTREAAAGGSVTLEAAEMADTDGVEGRILRDLGGKIEQEIERRFERLRAGVAEDVSRNVFDRLEEIVAKKVQESRDHGKAEGFDAARIRDLMTDVLKASLFDSGVLEKFIERTWARKIEARQGQTPGGDTALKAVEERLPELSKKVRADCVGALRGEIASIAQKEASAALSGENLKILIDEKFRAISIYLKTDVIPKAVAQALKGSRR